MNHLDEGTFQSLIDGELSEPDRRAAERHIETCAACANGLRDHRAAVGETSAALEVLDRPAPVDAAYDAVLGRRSTGWLQPGSLPRAAILVLGFAAVASAAVPGSPVRTWATALIDRIGGGEQAVPEAPAVEPEAPLTAPSTATPDEAGGSAGIAVTPEGDEMRVLVGSSPGAVRLRVRVVDAAEVSVSAERTVGARFETGAGRVRVSAAGPGTITIELPRALLRAEVAVGDTPYVRKEGERLHVLVSPTDTTGTDLVFDIGATEP